MLVLQSRPIDEITVSLALGLGLKCLIKKIGKLNNAAKRFYGLAGLVAWLECLAVHIGETRSSLMVGAAPPAPQQSHEVTLRSESFYR